MKNNSHMIKIVAGIVCLILAVVAIVGRPSLGNGDKQSNRVRGSALDSREHWDAVVKPDNVKHNPTPNKKIAPKPEGNLQNAGPEFLKTARNMSTSELETYFEKLSKELDENEFAEAVASILMAKSPHYLGLRPNGTEIVSLRDQISLCERFVSKRQQGLVHSYIRAPYKGANDMETYRREALETMQPSSYRAEGYGEYFYMACRDLAGFKTVLESQQLEKLNNASGANGPGVQSNYSRALKGVNSAFYDMIVKKEATPDQIVGLIQSAHIEDSCKQALLQSAQYWVSLAEKK